MTRALIVDDERPLLRALSMNLAARHYDVTEADTGTRALIAIATGEYDVILLDLGLPDISGLDVIRAVRQHSTHPDHRAVSAHRQRRQGGRARPRRR